MGVVAVPVSGWIVCQLGAREHYAVARALGRAGRLARLLTDAWCPPGALGRAAPARLRQRYHPELAGAPVSPFTASSLAFEASLRLRGSRGWDAMMRRNRWFMDQCTRALRGVPEGGDTVVFAYSYAALGILRLARERGWRTVLGQIDPGIAEERIVAGLHRRHAGAGAGWEPAPAPYWADWREECRLADCVMVNSAWSREALAAEGVPPEKITIVPLAYAKDLGKGSPSRAYPKEFGPGRPLRVLFLGQAILRKGIMELLEAAGQMQADPVEFRIVGRSEVPLRDLPNVRWIGPVSRATTEEHYREADVFLFPTHSDGFGLTQLEARAHGLPLVVSQHCGEVVRPGVNGILLDAVDAPSIAAALRRFIDDPPLVEAMGAAAEPAVYTIDALAASLARLDENPSRGGNG